MLKINTYQKGLLSELYVLVLYLLKYKAIPLKWRYKTKLGEVDLIMKSKDIIVFIEVKYRSNGEFFDLIAEHDLRRIRSAATIYLKRHPRYQNFRARLDICYLGKGFKFEQKQNIF